MSTVSEALKAVREALLLADKIKRTADATLELTKELRDHDRRITPRGAVGHRNAILYGQLAKDRRASMKRLHAG